MSKQKVLHAVKHVGDKAVIPVGVAAAGGVVANQIPQNQRSSKKAREDVFKSDNEFATRMYNLVMKMDEDEARLFTAMVVRDVLDDTIEKNQRTIQRHLNSVVAKRKERIKKALLSSASKDRDQATAFAKALDLIEKNQRLNPYDRGYRFQETDFNRDPGSGRFRVKVTTQGGTPINDKTATSMGIPTYPQRMHDEDKAAYQQEYMQIAQFLDNMAGNPGDHNMIMHIRDKNGLRYTKNLNGRPTASEWDPRRERVVGLEARPAGLTVGGAAFGLATALGGNMSDQTTHMIDRATDGQHVRDFSNEWTKDVEADNTNARLYNNLAAGSKFLGHVAPYGSHAQIAAKFGEFVGSHGPDAEKVFGPPSRRAAYRYRGTEKTPDRALVRDYNNAVRGVRTRAATTPAGYMNEEQRTELRARISEAQNREVLRRTAELNRDNPETVARIRDQYNEETGQIDRVPNIKRPEKLTTAERTRIAQDVTNQYLKEVQTSAPKTDPKGMEAGRAVLLKELSREGKAPNKKLYSLHLDAGNTPPSEGFLIDAQGKLVTQAIGYGDDHYLPFNLKNLKQLRGGEYIRNRSVGGPTAEDIYTGLMAGADRVTVVSRSGTFTVQFAPDFSGRRRYNDKAGRMVNRYRRLLDSIQSEQIDRMNIDPRMKQAIATQVREKWAGASPAKIREQIRIREDEYKHNPDLSEENEVAINAWADRQREQGMPEGQANQLRAELLTEARNEREYKYKLNGDGYGAALDALQEQFPYYIETKYTPRDDPEKKLEVEPDKGYVEPGRNRPTRASAGWHGMQGTGFDHKGTKFSASDADYQRGVYGPRQPKLSFVTVLDPKTGQPVPGGVALQTDEERRDLEGKFPDEAARAKMTPAERKEDDAKKKLAQIRQRQAFAIEGAKIAHAIKLRSRNWDEDKKDRLLSWMDRDQEGLENYLSTPEGESSLRNMIDAKGEQWKKDGVITEGDLVKIRAASGGIQRQPHSRAIQLNTNAPNIFDGAAYEDPPNPAAMETEKEKLAKQPAWTTNKTIAEMATDEIKHELGMMRRVVEVRDVLKDMPPVSQRTQLSQYGIKPEFADRAMDSDLFDLHAEALQRQRTLEYLKPKEAQNQVRVAPTEIKEVSSAPLTQEQVSSNTQDFRDYADTFREAAVKARSTGRPFMARGFQDITDDITSALDNNDIIDDDTFDMITKDKEFSEAYENARKVLDE